MPISKYYNIDDESGFFSTKVNAVVSANYKLKTWIPVPLAPAVYELDIKNTTGNMGFAFVNLSVLAGNNLTITVDEQLIDADNNTLRFTAIGGFVTPFIVPPIAFNFVLRGPVPVICETVRITFSFAILASTAEIYVSRFG